MPIYSMTWSAIHSIASQLLQRPSRRRAQSLVRGLGPLFKPRRKPAQPAVAHRDGHIAPQPHEIPPSAPASR